MQDQLLSGVPKEQHYRSLINSDKYKEMEKFSNNFLSFNKKFLGSYARKWVRDPLHQWSRQWEYPYVFNRVEAIIQNNLGAATILDAGSGITFLPYFIKSLYPATNMYCVDNDINLDDIYRRINNHSQVTVDFSYSDLRNVPFIHEQFDAVYCISVLEHTDEYAEIIEEFWKILRPGGRLVITFDISLDGTRDISVEGGTKLINSLTKKFEIVEDIPAELSSEILTPDIFTTHTARDIDPNLLPWKLPQLTYRLNSLIKGNKFTTWPPLLTIFCLNMRKSS